MGRSLAADRSAAVDQWAYPVEVDLSVVVYP